MKKNNCLTKHLKLYILEDHKLLKLWEENGNLIKFEKENTLPKHFQKKKKDETLRHQRHPDCRQSFALFFPVFFLFQTLFLVARNVNSYSKTSLDKQYFPNLCQVGLVSVFFNFLQDSIE